MERLPQRGSVPQIGVFHTPRLRNDWGLVPSDSNRIKISDLKALNQSQGGIYICGALKIGQGTPVKLFHPYVEDGPSPLLALRHMHISPWYQFSSTKTL